MKVSYLLHFLLAGWSVLTGIACGALYEPFRFLHWLHPKRKCLIFFEDLLFCLLCTVGLLLLFFNLSYGRMRLYAFAGFAAGFAGWYFTAGRLIRRAGARLAERLRPHLRYRRALRYTKRETRRIGKLARSGFGTGKRSSGVRGKANAPIVRSRKEMS